MFQLLLDLLYLLANIFCRSVELYILQCRINLNTRVALNFPTIQLEPSLLCIIQECWYVITSYPGPMAGEPSLKEAAGLRDEGSRTAFIGSQA